MANTDPAVKALLKALDEVQKQIQEDEESDEIEVYRAHLLEKEQLTMAVKDLVKAGKFSEKESELLRFQITSRFTVDPAALRKALGEAAKKYIKTKEEVDTKLLEKDAKDNVPMQDAVKSCKKLLSTSVTLKAKKDELGADGAEVDVD